MADDCRRLFFSETHNFCGFTQSDTQNPYFTSLAVFRAAVSINGIPSFNILISTVSLSLLFQSQDELSVAGCFAMKWW